jgi:ribose/xylose/arabinose/galactoside ABC-type transport system permease subunit
MKNINQKFLQSGFVTFLKNQKVLAILIPLLILVSTQSNKFWSLYNLQGLWVIIAMDGIMLVGMVMVMLTAGLDLSIGAIMSLAGVICVYLMNELGLPMWAGILGGILVGALGGAMNGLFITTFKINPFIATLGTMITFEGLAMTITDGYPVVNKVLIFSEIGRGKLGIIPIPAIILVVIFTAGVIFLHYTETGRSIYAIGGNEEAAHASGIRVKRVKFITYTICGLTAGISGVILASRLSTGSPIVGSDSALNVITAAMLGGISMSGGVGTLEGAFLGVLTMGVLSNSFNMMNIQAYYQQVIKGILLLVVIVIDRVSANSRKKALERTRGKVQA